MIRSLITVRWLPYAVLGASATALLVYGLGYSKGSRASRLEMTEVMNETLVRQAKVAAEIHQLDLAVVTKAMSREQQLEKTFDAIPRTGSDCNSLDWLLTFNAGVHAANTYSKSPDAAADAAETGRGAR